MWVLEYTIIVTGVHWGPLWGIVNGLMIPLLAGLLPAWSTIRIQPAEAMRRGSVGTGLL